MRNEEEWEDEFLPPMEWLEEELEIEKNDDFDPLENIYLHILGVFIIFTLSSAVFGLFLPSEEITSEYIFDDGNYLINTEEKSIFIQNSESILTYFPYKTGYTFYFELEDGRTDKMLAYWEEGGRARLISLHNKMPLEVDYWEMVHFLNDLPQPEEKRISQMSELARFSWFRILAISMTCVLTPQLYWFFFSVVPKTRPSRSAFYSLFEGYDDGYQGVFIRKLGKFYLVVSMLFFIVEWFAGKPVWVFW